MTSDIIGEGHIHLLSTNTATSKTNLQCNALCIHSDIVIVSIRYTRGRFYFKII